MNIDADDADAPVRVAAFVQGLQELDLTIGRNLRIEYRWTAGEADRIRGFAAEISAFSPDVIIASGGTHRLRSNGQPPPCRSCFSAFDPVAARLVQPGPAGRDCHGFHRVGIWHQRQAAGAGRKSPPALHG